MSSGLGSLSRRERFLGPVTPETQILEVGALNRPTVIDSGMKVFFADFTDTVMLRQHYSRYQGFDINAIVDVNFVVENGDFISAVGDHRFDLVLASHVGEHMPNFIEWLHQMHSVLNDGGILSLILPDKRFTFDLIRNITTAAEILTAYQASLRKPSAQQIYDHVSGHIALNGIDLWNLSNDPIVLKRVHTEDEVWMIVRNTYLSDQYFDSHCFTFTPAGFYDILLKLEDLSLLPFEIESFEDTQPGCIDFFVRLRKVSQTNRKKVTELPHCFNLELPYVLRNDGHEFIVSRR